MTTTLQADAILLEGLCFGEGPRWHNDVLWFSDMHAHWVMTVDEAGETTRVVEVPECPSGLGWTTDGDLLVVSMNDRRLLRWDGEVTTVVSDLSDLASFYCNDCVTDAKGRTYVGNFGFDLHGGAAPTTAELILVEPDGSARMVADGLRFPNGTVITPDGHTLIVAESWGACLTAFDVEANGDLTNQRQWADLPEGVVPDGICLDDHDGIWVASPGSNECLRVEAGGAISHRIPLSRGAYACMLGGRDQKTLFILTAEDSSPEATIASRSGRIETAGAPYPRAGWP